MTIEQYKDKASKRIMSSLFLELKEHDSQFVPQTQTDQYWLQDLILAVTPGDVRALGLKFRPAGHGMEICSGWPYVIFFQNGRLILGENVLLLDTYERAVETLRHMVSIFPKIMGEYEKLIESAEIELQKQEMVGKMYVSTIMSLLKPEAESAGGDIRIACGHTRIDITVFNSQGLRRHFYMGTSNPMKQLEETRSMITEFLGGIQAATL